MQVPPKVPPKVPPHVKCYIIFVNFFVTIYRTIKNGRIHVLLFKNLKLFNDKIIDYRANNRIDNWLKPT